MAFLESHAAWIQASTLLAAYLAALLWEGRRPVQRYSADDGGRITSNFGLLLLNQALPYLLVPVTALLGAWLGTLFGLGLLASWDAPWAVVLLLAVLALDLTGWLLHRAMHRFGPLWRIHQVHHSDLKFDSALGFRFHPAEVALVALASAAVVMTLGLPAWAVLLSALLTTAHNFFDHANAGLGERAERWWRRILITPDLHRVHHAADPAEGAHNYGIVLSCWDRMAGTLRLPLGHGPSDFGLEAERDPRRLSLLRLLLMPVRRAR